MIEISLVSVEKEDIRLMMDENGCFLSASADGGVEYVATIPFLRAVKPSEAKALFTDGFLRIEVPFKYTLDRFVKVPIEEEKGKPGIKQLTQFGIRSLQNPAGY